MWGIFIVGLILGAVIGWWIWEMRDWNKSTNDSTYKEYLAEKKRMKSE